MIEDIFTFRAWISNTNLIIIVIAIFSGIFAFTQNNLRYGKSSTLFPALALAALIIFRLGCLPVGWGFSYDRENYANGFLFIKEFGYQFNMEGKDPLWGVIMKLISYFGDAEFFFICQSSIYIGLYLFACQRFSKNNVYWLLIASIASLAFTNYGINTIRAGIAISFIFAGLSFREKKIVMYIFFICSLLVHLSMIIPISMLLISKRFNETRIYIYIWVLALVLSLVAGNTFNSFFATFIEDDRTSYLMQQNAGYKQGFRWDFVVYSLAPIAVGGYYIIKRKYRDRFYMMMFNAYILTNSFWVLVIRANFTDRFAYLSWFMIPLVLVYPLLQRDAPVKRPNYWLATILLGEAAFKMI